MQTFLHLKNTRPPIAILAILSLAVGGLAADTTPATTGQTARLLTVGNSFSQNATLYLPSLATAGGHRLIHLSCAVGGASLQLHADKAQLHEQNPTDKGGLYTKDCGLKEELAADHWDFVTIQQYSLKSHDIATYRPYARQLYDYIQKYAPGAAVLMHETWAYRCDDPRFAVTSQKPGEPATQEAMYQGLTNAYQTIAAELGVRIIPVGDAFHLADTDPWWGYRPDTKFDFKTAQWPALPDQTHSLHSGWRWSEQKLSNRQDPAAVGTRHKLSEMDGHHASDAGQYLAACVFYEVLFGESVVGNKFAPPDLDPAYVRFLQETAHQAVVNSRAKK